MSNEEKQLLFGEYASGNISPTDKRRLMAAALEDQDLFNSIAEQEELSELTVTLPSLPTQPPPRRNPWPFLFTGAAALALTVVGTFFLRTQNEPKTEVAQAPSPQPKVLEPAPPLPQRAAKPSTADSRENKIIIPEAPAQATARDELAAAPPPPAARTSPPKSTPAPTKEKTEPVIEPVLVGTLAALPPFQILRRGSNGEFTPAAELQDGDHLVVRYVPTQSGPLELFNLGTNAPLATTNAITGISVDIPLTAVRGTMNLELHFRSPAPLLSAESRAAEPAPAPASASGGAAKEGKAAVAAPSPSVRIFLTVR